jgi:hypothetical protein
VVLKANLDKKTIGCFHVGLEKTTIRRQPMTEPIVALQEYLRNVGMELDGDVLREGIAVLTRLLMELEVSQQIGAERYQRTEER